MTIVVGEGDEVEASATLATIEAMKMEASITAPRAGTVEGWGATAPARVPLRPPGRRGTHRRPLAEGKRLLLGLEAIGEPDERGYRTVMCRMNGQLRPIPVRDLSITADANGAEKGRPGEPRPRRAGDHARAGDRSSRPA